MSITVTISPKDFSYTLKDTCPADQWELAEVVLCESAPQVLAKALDWLGQNGCCFNGDTGAELRRKEAEAITKFITACYSRHDKGTPEGDAIRSAIKLAIQANDQKDAK